MNFLPLLPPQASTIASEVDHLYYFLLAVSAFFVAIIFLGVAFFAIHYRQRSADEVPVQIAGSWKLEAVWAGIPLLISMVMFGWATSVFFDIQDAPANSMPIYAVGKQWMWKFQHPEGNREIDELHVPAGQNVRITLTSEDVIHSLFIPAFRVKQDAVPGRYTSLWFKATKPGIYHLFCAEYCGTNHSLMRGSVIVMEPQEYEAWLAGDVSGGSMAARGERLFNSLGCVTCHVPDGSGRCPTLVGLYGRPVQLVTGELVTADDAYIRESILRPNAKIVAAFQPIMPTYQGQVSEERVLQLIAYIKSLAPAAEPGRGNIPAEALTPGRGPAPGAALSPAR
jgi:cytochrome c oxidase subunit 2